MAWTGTKTSNGSWWTCIGASGPDVAAALAKPGSWKWHPANAVLVRADQVGSLV